MKVIMKGNGKREKLMAKVNWFIKMEIFMKVIGKMIWQMGMAFILIVMDL